MGIILTELRMKFVIAIIGTVAALQKRNYHREEPSSSSSSSDDEDLQLMGDFFHARDIGTGTLDKKYERVPPENFSSDSDDLFMRSMIMKYAMEGKNEDESPNGAFFMDEASTRAASSEVLSSHKGLKGAELAEYMKTYFPRTWAHYDVNHAGHIGVESMPQFMRFLASDQTLNL